MGKHAAARRANEIESLSYDAALASVRTRATHPAPACSAAAQATPTATDHTAGPVFSTSPDNVFEKVPLHSPLPKKQFSRSSFTMPAVGGGHWDITMSRPGSTSEDGSSSIMQAPMEGQMAT